MPHIVIEYSQDSFESKDIPYANKALSRPQDIPSVNKLEGLSQGIPGLVNSVFDAVVNTNIVKPENIKVRTYAAEFYKLGLMNTGFIHAVCKTHTGKSDLEKQALSQAILKSLEQFVQSTAENSIVITVEVVEMDRSSYSKSLIVK